jgi:hypothetical protein
MKLNLFILSTLAASSVSGLASSSPSSYSTSSSNTTLTSLGSTDGINCNGSHFGEKGPLSTLIDIINDIDPNRVYSAPQHIACIPGSRNSVLGWYNGGGFCAFLQSTKYSINGGQIKNLMKDLADHGCKGCGSVPIDFDWPTSNSPANGILTVNYVVDTASPCPNGLC